MEAIILAGGLGTRLRHLIPDLPKPMAPIRGRPFLEYLLDYWITQGVTRVIFSVGYKAQAIQSHFGHCYNIGDLDYSVEEVPLGTGGGLLLAIDRLRQPGPFLVLNGDTFFEVELAGMVQLHREHSAAVTMALLEVPQNGRYQAIGLGAGATITSLASRQAPGGTYAVNGGVYLIEKSAMDGISWRPGDKLSLEEELFPALFEANRLFCGYVSSGRFIDIGVPEDYHAASALLRSHTPDEPTDPSLHLA